MIPSGIASLETLMALPLMERNAQSIIDLVVEQLEGTTLTGQGTGYVICAGGRYAKYGYATCRWIREVLGDDVPIEWWIGNNEFDPVPHGAGLESWFDGIVVAQSKTSPGSWPLKARAVLNSNFEKVILLDADCLPMVKAQDVWDKPFLNTGALFFPDITSHRRSDWAYAVLKLHPDAFPEMEAGQLLIDRVRHAKAVVLVDYFNQHPEFFYTHHHGDKDLWALAFARLGIPFTTGGPCMEHSWGLSHFLPEGDWYSDHLIHVKSGQPYGSKTYQSYLDEYARLFPA